MLHGGRGELEALGHLDGSEVPFLTPLLEIPTGRAAPDLAAELRSRLPGGLVVGVDPGDATDVDLTRWGVPLLPVIGLAESDQRLTRHGEASRAWLRRAVVRLRTRHDRGGPDAATASVERIWRLTGLVPEQCDLVIDLADVCCAADVRTAEPRARRLVNWAHRHAWRSVTVTAGAMPPTLGTLPTDEVARLPRWDWLLWRQLVDLRVDFGDYGLRSALPAFDVPADRLPTMAYTAEETWWVYRWSRRGGRGDHRFTDLCRTLVSAPYWPPAGAGFSWGDHEILRRARHAAGPGSTSNWTAWSTSHHLTQVLTDLRRPAPADRQSDPGHEPPGGRRSGHGRTGRRATRGDRSGWPPRGGADRRAG
ncbi:beta family protein [Micromonospora echinofusca]|uniref:Beta protein n=1 Tax=Micromonospora echinofusca TaxID=47858 RepID=A0ABS3VVX9_MICEH|nr:beta family protein [Micromonospora echinofusca]MBO4208665.1 hypothetical protein [Micromonospora echinofusca]